ncbi:hypothetical protein DFH08DRAFT_723519 [Mycena albidolilacea]|uniref:C2H2-type domain-containing protein n=1 Tax=Mycena albidolilacea TaxID=1033008 RepID=A0AAD6YZ46_9AGAR|nr:hypothetical protein DFH08DRAFT_723519 [Mycena albidolilacea]
MTSASRPPALQPYPLSETACKSKSKSESDSKLVSEERCHTGVFKSESESESPKAQRHACPRCGREFMSNGHLKRHVITHSGQKNHPCPFPGCAIKCSRHDNLQQQ